MKGVNQMDLNKAMNKLKESKKSESNKLAKLVEKKEIKKESVEEKKLTELRHVDKKVIVKGYDFKELSKEIQDQMINKYNRDNKRISSKDTLVSDLKQSAKENLDKEIKANTIFTYTDCSVYNEIEYAKAGLKRSEILEAFPEVKLKEEIDMDSILQERGAITGYYQKEESWDGIDKKILQFLKADTNYKEIPKADKKSILLEIKESMEKAEELLNAANEKFVKDLEEIKASDSTEDKLNSKAIEEFSKYWYTERGEKIVSKEKAKVVNNIDESLLKESPVDLEFDHGYDVYSYDDLDDWGKRNAFNSTERSRKNEFDRTFNELEKKVMELGETELNKVGLKMIPKDPEKWNRTSSASNYKQEMDRVDYVIDPESLNQYAKNNGVELEHPVSFAYLDFRKSYHSYRGTDYNMNINIDYEGVDYSDQEKGDRALKKELELDLESLEDKLEKLVNDFKGAIDDDFRKRLSKDSTDRKLRRREYDSRGNIYRKKDHPEDK